MTIVNDRVIKSRTPLQSIVYTRASELSRGENSLQCAIFALSLSYLGREDAERCKNWAVQRFKAEMPTLSLEEVLATTILLFQFSVGQSLKHILLVANSPRF